MGKVAYVRIASEIWGSPVPLVFHKKQEHGAFFLKHFGVKLFFVYCSPELEFGCVRSGSSTRVHRTTGLT